MDKENKSQNEQSKVDDPLKLEPTPPAVSDQPTPPPESDLNQLANREPMEMMDEEEMMDRTIEVSEKLAKYEKALDMVLTFIIKRCYAGDFVSHDSEDKPMDERTANINNAAAERIARDLGIRESNRTSPEKITDKEGHYTFTCTGDFSFRGQVVKAMGQATTRNAFYSKAYGKQKPVAEIREDYVRTECMRDLTKQGVRKIFGLRKIPLTKLEELGYDISKVRVVSFKSGDESQAKKNPGATKSLGSTKWLTLTSSDPRKYGNTSFVVFKVKGGGEISCWHTGETLKKAKDSIGVAQVKCETSMKGKYENIEKVLEVAAV